MCRNIRIKSERERENKNKKSGARRVREAWCTFLDEELQSVKANYIDLNAELLQVSR